ncbi:GDP-mannose 4,6-dehydratase, partial [Candidatus Woesearchaeota archaeon]|nr:GDP-mannose 4,6-dehydratase [Candidatus Woesearchaeota archaeon]
MNVPKKALITGITGQDGSYLAELLLEKGYEVFGIIRRASTFNTSRINHLFKDPHEKDVKLHLIHGDLDDSSTINRIIREIMPDEIYNLGAQSHVRVSFDIPEYTGNVTGLGALRILETIHRIEQENRKRIKYYQASSSEMFGKVQETPQNEKTPFYPRSPYGVAKVYSYWTTKNYREAYNIFACNGILFNHECISENTPLIVRNKSTQIISIKRIKDIRRAREKGRNIQQWILDNIGIWDGEQFVDLKLITATRRKRDDNNFHCKIINTRHGVIETTNHHNLIDYNNQKIRAREVDIGQKLLHKTFPAGEEISRLSEEEALFLGMMVGDGYISEDGEKGQFSNMDEKIIKVMGDLWRKIALGSIITKEYKTEYGKTKQTSLKGNSGYLKLARKEIYTYDKFKKVPDRILNGSKNIKLAFLMGYNITDGLKSNPTIYEFKNFKTNSIVLAQGLLFLIKNTTNQGFNITFEEDKKNYGYYSVNFLSPTDNSLKEETVAQLLDEGHGQRQICMET